MPARAGQPGTPRPNAGRAPALLAAAQELRQRVGHWLGDDARAVRIETAALSEVARVLRECEVLIGMELERRSGEQGVRGDARS